MAEASAEAAAEAVVDEHDPLDDKDFDPIAYINKHFPDEASLENLDTFVVGIDAQMSTIDEEISSAVQTQSGTGHQGSEAEDIADAQEAILELSYKIQDIKGKAKLSEKMVNEICAEIKQLDYAKNHLQASMTALKRLQMLITAVNQLELLARDFQYREVANLLDAVKQLMGHFETYTEIPMIEDIKTRLDLIQTDLQKHVRKAFREMGQLADSVADMDVLLQSLPGNLKSLSDVCLVVDALGVEARQDMLEEFVELQLIPYEQLFGADQEFCNLESVDRRWAWFKRLLKQVESKFSNLCPPRWRFPLRLCLEFMERTKSHLSQMLVALDSKDAIDVNNLLKALQSTLRFEQEMGKHFDVASFQIKSEDVAETALEERLRMQGSLMCIPTDHSALDVSKEEDTSFLALAHAAICGGLSGTFDKFLGCYVQLERQNLEDMLKRLSMEEDTAEEGAALGSSVFNSSMHMFNFIKTAIKRCTALTKGPAFMALSLEFKKSMQNYAQMLRDRLPFIITNMQSGNVLAKIPAGQEGVVCHVINTGEYCAEVVPQLEQLIRTKMAAQLSEKVDLQTEVDTFMDLVAHAMKVLVAGVMDRLEPAMRLFVGTNWDGEIDVGEESSYVLQFHRPLVDFVPKVRQDLTGSYFNSFCTKVATELLERYRDGLMRQKRISESGTQQLLLDAYSIKTLLLQLHTVGLPADPATGGAPKPAAPVMYTKLTSARCALIENLLKLVATPEGMLFDRFQMLWPDGRTADLLSIMALKGMKRAEQQALLDKMGSEKHGSALGAEAVKPRVELQAPTGTYTGTGLSSLDPSGLTMGGVSQSFNKMGSSMKSLTTSMGAMGNLKWAGKS